MSARDTKAAGMLVALLAVVALARESSRATPQLVVSPPVKRVASGAALALREGRPLDLNHATVEDLCILPRIGRALAERIVRRRTERGPFRSLRDLDEVEGIGPHTLELLAPLLMVQNAPANP